MSQTLLLMGPLLPSVMSTLESTYAVHRYWENENKDALLDSIANDCVGYLVNVSRGTLVDEAALVSCLQNGQIAGAGLDVFADEPNIPEALFSLDNVVLQPHNASGTWETREAMGKLVLDNLAAHFSAKPLLTAVV